MNTCTTCCNPKTPDCDSVEMSNLQRCNGVTMHGCGNPMYNVYCWDHAHPVCHKPEPVAILHLCAYLRKDEAAHIYTTKQETFDLQAIIAHTYQTKDDAAVMDQKIDQEIADRIEGDIKLEGELQAQSVILEGIIQAETNRATNREDELLTAIDAEQHRAQVAEEGLQRNISAEKTRAQAAETALNTAVQANTSAIANEVSRAQTAENNLSTALASLNHTVITDLVHSADYNTTTKQIEFKNSEGTIIDSIDASAFIKDGMVSNVQVINGVLKITFNTDAGKQDIDIPISSIFDANNYYTKTQSDSRYYTKAQIDAIVATAISNALANYYTKSQADAKFATA